MKKFGAFIATAMSMALLFTGCGGSSDSKEAENAGGVPAKVVVGTNPEFPPFEFVGNDGKIDGYDVALMNEVGKRAGFEVEWKSMDFDALIMAMETGGIDVAISGMTATEERKKQVDFSDTYFNASQVMIVKTDNDTIKTFQDLKGKNVGVQQGTTGDLMISEGDSACIVEGVTVKRMNKGADAVLDLINGGVDAVVIDQNPAEEFVKANEGKIKVVTDEAANEEYAIAIPKSKQELKEAINGALKEMKEDGTLDQFAEQYGAK